MPFAAVLSPWIAPINTSLKAPSLHFYYPHSHGFPHVSQHRRAWNLNASAEKHTSGNDLATPLARVMNSANCAYHGPLLLVLIASVTTRLESRWALLPRARHIQVLFLCGLFKCLAADWGKTSESHIFLQTQHRSRANKEFRQGRSLSRCSLAFILYCEDTQHEHMRQIYYVQHPYNI